jgi:uncharacterized protein YecT (DUF1311 family)
MTLCLWCGKYPIATRRSKYCGPECRRAESSGRMLAKRDVLSSQMKAIRAKQDPQYRSEIAGMAREAGVYQHLAKKFHQDMAQLPQRMTRMDLLVWAQRIWVRGKNAERMRAAKQAGVSWAKS